MLNDGKFLYETGRRPKEGGRGLDDLGRPSPRRTTGYPGGGGREGKDGSRRETWGGLGTVRRRLENHSRGRIFPRSPAMTRGRPLSVVSQKPKRGKKRQGDEKKRRRSLKVTSILAGRSVAYSDRAIQFGAVHFLSLPAPGRTIMPCVCRDPASLVVVCPGRRTGRTPAPPGLAASWTEHPVGRAICTWIDGHGTVRGISN